MGEQGEEFSGTAIKATQTKGWGDQGWEREMETTVLEQQ